MAACIRVLLRLIGRLPLPVGRAAGLGVGALLWLVPARARRTTRANIDRCFPELTPAERRRLVRRSLLHTGRTLTDSAWAWMQPARTLSRAVREIHGFERLLAARDEGRGIIFACPHIGCWEMVGLFLPQYVPLTSLYRPPRLRALEPLLVEGRQHTGATLVPTDSRGVRAIHRALKAGDTVGILPDQAPHEGHGIIAPFFGQPARTMTLLSRLARSHRATVLFCVMQRLPNGRGFRLHMLPASPDVSADDDRTAAAAVNRDVERCIALCPEQYMWSYRRFRRTDSRRRRP